MGSDEEDQSLIDQAAAWLVGLDAGTADRAAFEAWRQRSPYHQAAFAQAAAIWSRTAEIRHLGEMTEPTSVAAPADRTDEPRIGRRALIAAAMTGVIGASAGATWMMRDDRQLVETAFRTRRSVLLPDGSVAALNSDTRLRWRFDDVRALWIERGECALDVATHARAPMQVNGPAFAAGLATGHYNIRLFEQGASLSVLAGTARVTFADAGPRIVAAGRQLAWQGGRFTETVLSDALVARIAAWQQGEILFDGMTLAQAAAEFNRYLTRKLVIADSETAAIRLGGRFMIDDPEAFLRALRDGFDVASRVDGDVIRLSR